MVYLYAICAPSTRPVPEPLGGLRTVEAGRLEAVVGDPPVLVEVTEDALWEHEEVVEALMRDRPVLPVRFGSVLADDGAVRRLLEERQQELVDALRRVEGAVELSVRAGWAPDVAPGAPEVEPGRRGTDYLLGRARDGQRVAALSERLDRALGPLVRARTARLSRSPSVPLTLAYLVGRDDVEAFRERVAALAQQVDGARLVCTGPWPPYSFSGGGPT